MNTVGYTCQITAGFRAVELTLVEPIIHDHLAPHLAGAALQQALSDYQNLLAAQGPGRSLRVPARNRIMDDFVTEALQHLAAQKADATGLVQVVNLGCGMVGQQTQRQVAGVLKEYSYTWCQHSCWRWLACMSAGGKDASLNPSGVLPLHPFNCLLHAAYLKPTTLAGYYYCLNNRTCTTPI